MPEDKVDSNEQLFHSIKSEIDTSKANTENWANNHDKFYRLRFRVKKAKTFPFTGCSNLRLPTIETYIRKTKSALIGIYSNIKPRMQVIPQSDQDLNKANKMEKFLDYLADYKIMLLEKLILGCDKMLEKGFFLAKVTWCMKNRTYTEELSLSDLSMEDALSLFDSNIPDEAIAQELIRRLDVDMSETVMEENLASVMKAVQDVRSGKDKIKVTLKDELYNAPDVFVCDPANVFVPSDAGMDVQDLRWICHEYYEPIEVLRQRADEGIYDKEAVNEIISLKDLERYDSTEVKDKDKIIDSTKSTREGIDRLSNPSHLVKIWEVYKYYNPVEGEPEQKWQFILTPEFNKIIKKQVLPYDHQKFPFVRFHTEIVDDRWFSPRGIPEHLEDISKEIDAQHNQRIDSQTIRNAPMFKFRSGVVNPKLVRFIPAQGIPVSGMQPLDDSIKLMDNTNINAEFSYEREEMLLKTVIQEYLGQVDYSLQSMINKRQPRTLGEVQMQAQNANQVFSLDSTMWTTSIAELFTQIMELCQQYMPERVFALVVGQDDLEPIHITRDEIQGKYDIVCRGNDNNTNPYVKAQKSQMRVQLLLGNPIALQAGVITPPNIYNIYKRYLQDDGEIAWKELISMPQPPQPPQPPPAATLIKPDYKDLTDAEQAQVLQSAGVQPDMMGRALERREEMREDAFEESEQMSRRDMENHQKKMDIANLIMEMRNAEQKATIEKAKISKPQRPRPERP
jgi:hypothetical protein